MAKIVFVEMFRGGSRNLVEAQMYTASQIGHLFLDLFLHGLEGGGEHGSCPPDLLLKQQCTKIFKQDRFSDHRNDSELRFHPAVRWNR